MKRESINIGVLAVLIFVGFSTLLLSSFKGDLVKNAIPCGDLLSMYAEKPKNLAFVKCERLKNSQTKVRANYRVSGEQSKPVEDFLVERYGMGALRWVCCGWETMGKSGGFEHEALTKIDPYLSAGVDMFASGEVDKDQIGEVKLEPDRNKIEFFTVVVELSIV